MPRQAMLSLFGLCSALAAFTPGLRLGRSGVPVVQAGPQQLSGIPVASSTSRSGAASIRAAVMEPEVLEPVSSLADQMNSYVQSRGGDRVIRKILIANNGMAATKTIMSIRSWAYRTFGDEGAIKFVVMATPDDLAANAEFIRRADEFVEVPGGSNANNYANVQLIVDLCVAKEVDALMVGWGHASENPKLGDLLKEKSEEIGRTITFVGPTSPVIRVLGDKVGANLIAQTAGVPVPPWNADGLTADLNPDGTIPEDQFDAACIHSEQEAVDAAERIGYPVMLKASEGGGGKGIRMAPDEAALRAAYPQVLGEVPGSPVFLVSLCQGARHLEVQVVGDAHGNALALGGRDCSTQRRFQKIFEEGPPIIADDETFDDMMHAAVKLCQNIGYRSAGTVEYLYVPETKKWFFLELNPRLQVEHPVTEGITGVSLPVTQIHVAMGIPLYNIPEIREFYDEDKAAIGAFPLDTFKASSAYEKHVIAARITAENPDEGFKPTSGKIERINFQSNTKVWGYFSVMADGGVHEFADSQFGHIFATGETREEARKLLVMALKELFIMGEIRTTVEYLGELLETEAFKTNAISTAWLDGIIAAKSVGIEVEPTEAVINAAVYRAYNHVQNVLKDFQESLSKGQLSTLPLRELQTVPIEITYQDVKHSFTVTPTAPDTMLLSIGDQVIEVKTREQADGSLFVAYGSEIHQLYAKEEPLGLRMVLDGVTVLLPTLYDPSELRSDITGKLVRYLKEDGAEVAAGEPYAEAEAMKMLITIKADIAGRVKHEKNPGSILNQGDLIASLDLKDPSKVKKITPFTGVLEYGQSIAKEETTLRSFERSSKALGLIMDGYVADPEPMVQTMLAALSSVNIVIEEVQNAAATLGNKLPTELDEKLQGVFARALKDHVTGEDSKECAQLVENLNSAIEGYVSEQLEEKQDGLRTTFVPITTAIDVYTGGLREHAISVVCSLLSKFLTTEENFVGMPTDQAIAKLVKAKPEALDEVYNLAFAHEQLGLRSTLCISLLRQLSSFPERFGVAPLRQLPSELDVVSQLSQLPGSAYNEVALTAAQFSLMKAEKPFSEAVEELRQELLTNGPESAAVSRSLVTNALLALFPDPDVGQTAMQVAVKRFYRTYDITSMTTTASGTTTLTEFEYQAADKSLSSEGPPLRYGLLAVVSDIDALQAELEGLLSNSYKGEGPEPVNSLHIALNTGVSGGAGAEEQLIASMQASLQAQAALLKEKGIRLVSLMVPNPPKWPRQFSFTAASGYAEDTARRDMYPTMYNLLELYRLDNWAPTRLPSISHNSIVLLGSLGVKPRVQQRVFVRGITHGGGLESPMVAETALTKALDELQLAMLDKSVAATSSSHLFLHILTPMVDVEPVDVIKSFEALMSSMISKYATRLLKLKVDEIEVRAHVGDSDRQAVRLIASSMAGQWLKTDGYMEYIDPVTGITQSYCTVGDDEQCFLEPYPVSSTLENKRAVARRIGTTYAYDFLGLIEKALVKQWQSAIADGKLSTMPSNLLTSDELILDESGELKIGSQVVGDNKVGMLGWAMTLKTPQFPEGRPLVIVANDCTVQSGSFGVKEDEFFDKVSKYARERGFPRLHIASNSGARIGLATELIPYFKVAWNDPTNEAQGFKYLYLTEEDVGRFKEGTFHGSYITEEGEKRFQLDDIVGEQDGIGVENLRGSGLIAGETSAAYQETFTLSYVTGRSVGIGAYVNRLAQRVIQMSNGPMILTGFSALNKLLGKEVYTSQDQLGGPQIMLPNGIAHQLASDDQDGVDKILDWLSYVPDTAFKQAHGAAFSDPVERAVAFTPTPTPYDPRHMLAGASAPDGAFTPGFFDVGSFTEYLADWGKSVVVGRARLGGIPMGVISVETRLVEQRIPADPANPKSSESVLAQAGQVWYPDSAFKTAQAIADFNAAENLPLIIFANWRGFSGGTRDMYGEVLKFGAMIVDNLRNYKHPVFAYIPPHGELRGGAWVVIDPTINEDMMEMYVDCDARGGILEPPGICDVKFRKPDLLKTMHRLDTKLHQLSEELTASEESLDTDAAAAIRDQIVARENALLPLYVQISHEFADLHDRPGRMLAKGVIRDVVPWERSREYFYWRVRRRLAQDALISQLKTADKELSHAGAMALIKGWTSDLDWEDDKVMLDFFTSDAETVTANVAGVSTAAIKKEVASLLSSLSDKEKAALISSL